MQSIFKPFIFILTVSLLVYTLFSITQPNYAFAAACGAGGPCNLYGYVYVDQPPYSGNPGPEDTPIVGAKVVVTGAFNGTLTTGVGGLFIVGGQMGGPYTVKLTVPPGYTTLSYDAEANTHTNPDSVTMFPRAGGGPSDNVLVNFGLYLPPTLTPTVTPKSTPTINPNTPTPTPVNNAGTYSIAGHVFDVSSGARVVYSNATVKACTTADCSSPTATTTSDIVGNYILKNLPPGPYYVKIFAPVGFAVKLPTNGTDEFFVTVGPTCTANGSGAQCAP